MVKTGEKLYQKKKKAEEKWRQVPVKQKEETSVQQVIFAPRPKPPGNFFTVTSHPKPHPPNIRHSSSYL
jgi:hypothetical protein